MKMRSICVAVIICLAAGGMIAEAQLVSLSDANSSITVDPAAGLNSMMKTWTVDGVQQLYGLDYYYRVGNTAEAQLKSIAPLIGAVSSDTNPFSDPANDSISMLYSTPGYVDVELKISLLGGVAGSGWSDVAHQLKITNTGNAPLDFHLFEYADFDIGGTASGDTGTLFTPADEVYITDGQTVFTMDSIAVPDAVHGDITIFPTLLNLMKDGSPTVLSDNTGPVTGDVEYGLQWDVVIEPNTSFILSKDMLIAPIPEPASVGLIALASSGALFIRRRFMI